MTVLIEVLEKRDYVATDSKWGYAVPPVCPGCGSQATVVVVMRKFGHTFSEPKCPECASKYQVGEVVEKVRPTSYQIGLAKFWNIPVEVLLDMALDDRAVLQKFADAYRKEDYGTIEQLVKDNKSLIKQYWPEEDDGTDQAAGAESTG